MKYARVNLIKKAEVRYQGAVSGRFLLVSVIVTPIVLIALVSGMALMKYREVRSELDENKVLWSKNEPKLNAFKKDKEIYETCRSSLDLVNAWKESQLCMSDMLRVIRKRVPDTIQLNRLAIRNEGGKVRFSKPEELALELRLSLTGLAKGAQAEGAVIGLRKGLVEGEPMASVFDSVKLASIRSQTAADNTAIRQFRLEGKGKSGGKANGSEHTK